MAEKAICPKCQRRIRHTNAWHYCSDIAIDDLFLKSSDEIVLACDKILSQVSTWEDVDIAPTKNCVVFVRGKTFLVIKPMKKWLEVKFFSDKAIEDEAFHKFDLWGRKYFGILRFQVEEQITERFFEYFRASYLIS